MTYLFLLEFNGALRRRQAESSEESEESEVKEGATEETHTQRHVWTDIDEGFCRLI